jgi:hypothetical protein
MKVVFFKTAIPDDFQHGFYESPILTIPIPANWKGTRYEALEMARKLFKEHFGCTDTEYPAEHKFE